MAKKPIYEELEQRVKELEEEAEKRKLTEEALRESQEKYMFLVDNSKDITQDKQAEEDLGRANEELLKESDQRKALSKRLIDLLEKDRHNIAMELHDHIGQALTSLKMNLEMIHGKLKPVHTELGAQIKVAQEKTVQAIKDVKNVSHGLRPAMIDALGDKGWSRFLDLLFT